MSFQSQVLLESERFQVVKLTRTGQPFGDQTRDVIRHPGAVVIVPMVDTDHVCLISNYRIAVDQTLIELPAGTIETGEEPVASARRELAEETGLRAGRIEPLHEFYLSPGILDERMHVFVAADLTAGQPAREPNEQINNLVVPWKEALGMIDNHQIQDAKTITALLFYDRLRNP